MTTVDSRSDRYRPDRRAQAPPAKREIMSETIGCSPGACTQRSERVFPPVCVKRMSSISHGNNISASLFSCLLSSCLALSSLVFSALLYSSLLLSFPLCKCVWHHLCLSALDLPLSLTPMSGDRRQLPSPHPQRIYNISKTRHHDETCKLQGVVVRRLSKCA